MKSSTINIQNQFTINKAHPLGSGATGEVYQGKNLKDNADVAVKIIDLKTISNQVTKYLLRMEKEAVMMVDNSYVLKGINVVQNRQFCYIVTQLCNGGSLKTQLRMSGALSEQKSLKYLIQILSGECSLIEKGILHRDLKPANILLHNGSIKIIDFGYCQINGSTKPSQNYNVGSPSYMSPQAFHNSFYSQKSQIWAIGVTFYQCLNARTFDGGQNMGTVYQCIKTKGLPFKVQVSDRCQHILKWCFSPQVTKRPTCRQLLNFITNAQPQKIIKVSSKTRIEFTSLDNYSHMIKTDRKDYQKSKRTIKTGVYDLKKENIAKSIHTQKKIKPAFSAHQKYQRFSLNCVPPSTLRSLKRFNDESISRSKQISTRLSSSGRSNRDPILKNYTDRMFSSKSKQRNSFLDYSNRKLGTKEPRSSIYTKLKNKFNMENYGF